MNKGIIFISISSLCVSIGQLFWKISVVNGSFFNLIIGFIFYGLGAVLMIISFKYGEVSLLQPLISLSYIFAIIFGYLILNENITYGKIIGVIFIINGTIFLSRKNL